MTILFENNIKRIAIIGMAGAGKSVFSRVLAEKTGLPVYHVDSMVWGPGWTEIANAEWMEKEAAIVSRDQWILEGWMKNGYGERLRHANLVIYLDFSGLTCALRGFRRWWQYRKNPRAELPGCPEKLDLRFLWNILKRRERTQIEKTLRVMQPANIIRLKTPAEARHFIKETCASGLLAADS